ncbi:MAG TPA: dihydroorotate dehydrogenase electron transfer subunit [Clostridia bacterium]|nr:dihydroorotate dehydrogenase electron transfer subunit [Clostridia bacterium]
MKQNYKVIVLQNYQIADNLYKMSIEAPEIVKKAKPGQFLHIKVPGDLSLLLRRPISINGVNRKTGQLDLVYQNVGKGTEVLSQTSTGIELDILGPLGRGFSIPEGSKDIYIVGGGCGVAPVRFAAQEWSYLNTTSFLGFRSKSCIYQIEDFEEFSSRVFISTDDGSVSHKGSIVTPLAHNLEKGKPDLVLACGPFPMLRAIQKLVKLHGVPCQMSLEERMGCGIGGCLVCSCAVKRRDDWDYKKVCQDGPVFWSEEVILDESFESKS